MQHQPSAGQGAKLQHSIYAVVNRNGRVVYVGRSTDLPRRAAEHQKQRFTKAKGYRVAELASVEDDELADILESAFIHVYQPYHNRRKFMIAKDAASRLNALVTCGNGSRVKRKAPFQGTTAEAA